MNAVPVERWGEQSKERGGALWERADGVCLGVRSYGERGVVTRGAGGMWASAGLGPSLGGLVPSYGVDRQARLQHTER